MTKIESLTLEKLLAAKAALDKQLEYKPNRPNKYLVEHYALYGLPFDHPDQYTEKTAFIDVTEREHDYWCELGDYWLSIPKGWVVNVEKIETKQEGE